ncbi:MAG: hypothetical protein JNM94_08640 [Phycisphaerae bacterium]|nr:hypothetical protein [Phycisphaerae bacterium]
MNDAPTDTPPGPLETAEIVDDLLPPQAHSLSLFKRVLYLVIATVLILVGIVLWLMPVLTGVPFWMAGLVFLARTSERCRNAVNWVDRKMPTRVRRALRWARAKFGVAQVPLEGPPLIPPVRTDGEECEAAARTTDVGDTLPPTPSADTTAPTTPKTS